MEPSIHPRSKNRKEDSFNSDENRLIIVQIPFHVEENERTRESIVDRSNIYGFVEPIEMINNNDIF